MKCRILLLLAFGWLHVGLFAQSGKSLQRLTLSAVTLKIDSVNSVQKMELIRGTVKAYDEVRDFDIKYGNCNFTLDNSGKILDAVIQSISELGFHSEIYRLMENQTFTYVPEKSCVSSARNVANMSEEEVIQKGITRGTPPPVEDK